MAQITRRHFTQLAAASQVRAAGKPLPRRPLGMTGFEASIVGLGAQYLGEMASSQAAMDRVVGEAIDNGVNYIDTAPFYGVSESRLGRALQGKRNRVFVATKVETNAKRDAMNQIRHSLRQLQTDYLDCVHLHNISLDERFPSLEMVFSENGALGALIEARKQGLIGHIGCTSHERPARVLPAFQTGHIELLQCTVNFVERHIYNFEEKVLPEARRRQIGVIAMKVLGGPGDGPAARLSTARDYENALRYVLDMPGVAVALIGMRTPEELHRALHVARTWSPLDQAESRALGERGKSLATQWGPLRGPVS